VVWAVSSPDLRNAGGVFFQSAYKKNEARKGVCWLQPVWCCSKWLSDLSFCLLSLTSLFLSPVRSAYVGSRWCAQCT